MRLAALATPSRALWHSWGLQHSRQLQATRRHGVVQAEGDRQQQQQGQGEASTSQPPAAAAGPAPPRPSVRMPPSISRTPPPAAVDEASVTVQCVERRGDSRFAGVVALDRGDTPDSLGRVALLMGGDAAALLLFAAIGRVGHGESLALPDLLATTWPFMAGWFGSAALLGGFNRAATQGGGAGAAAATAAKCWALGIPAGLALRSLSRGYLPEPAFLAVSMGATGVLLLGWRAALAAAAPLAAEPQTPREQLGARKDRQGGAFEVVKMVLSMVKRW